MLLSYDYFHALNSYSSTKYKRMKHCCLNQFIFAITLLIISISKLHAQETILWEITKNDTEYKSYLLGTNHYVGDYMIEAYPVIKSKLQASDVLIVEYEIKYDSNQTQAEKKSDFSYKKYLGKKITSRLESVTKRWSTPLKYLNPNEVLYSLQVQYQISNCGFYADTDTIYYTFEKHLELMAHKAKKPVLSLENRKSMQNTFKQSNIQMSWKDTKEYKKYIKFWLYALNDLKNDPQICGFSYEYRDLKLPYSFDKDCDVSNFIINGKNKKWTPLLQENLERNNCFIAVGINFLMYKCGLIEQLKSKGYQVTPVLLKNSNED